MHAASEKYGHKDPVSGSFESSKLILNLLYEYSGLANRNYDNLKGLYAVNGIIIGLRWVYHDFGHTTNWHIRSNESGDKEASGNPLEGNKCISEFRKMYVKKLSTLGRITKSADPIESEHIIEHGKKFLLHCNVDTRDILLHAFLLVGMNCGMRFDELSKVKLEILKCKKYGVSFSIHEKTKNDWNCRNYTV